MIDTSSLEISTYEQAGVPVVAAEGDVDLATAPVLRTALDDSCRQRTDLGPVGVDLRNVHFIDSAGLALLVEMRKTHLDKCQLALVIAKGTQPERVLRLGRFDTFLRVVYSPEEIAIP